MEKFGRLHHLLRPGVRVINGTDTGPTCSGFGVVVDVVVVVVAGLDFPWTTFRRTSPPLDPPPPDRPKFRSFFSLSRHHFALLVSIWVSARGILVVFEAPERSNVHVWSSRVVV